MLEELGFSEAEEQVYRALLVRPNAATDDLGLHDPKDRELLDGLVTRGFVTRSAASGRYRVVNPGLALMTELFTRRDRLRRTELTVADLTAQHEAVAGAVARHGLAEWVEGEEEIAHRFRQLQLGARDSIDTFVTGNNRVVPHDRNSSEPVALDRGVAFRAVIDSRFLRQAASVEATEHAISGGAAIRVAEKVPMKLMVTDATMAMITVGATYRTTLLLHGPLAVLAGELFESVWRDARPYRQGDEGLDALETRLLHLMLAGLTDQAIGSHLGVSTRSVQRRIRELMDRAGVTTRIQLGWHARGHDWA
ncbi:hypothetical protein ACIBI4_02845 [Streptomyces sp. NPDC050418]|uniref:hypothetical protein n=1 Tax=Streptomyces sp. NPDC050418 TaxID=3365612 RepID=UPI0037A67DAB